MSHAPTATDDWFALDAASATRIPLYDTAGVRAIEHAAQAALPPFTLMARAGTAAAGWLARHMPQGPLLCLAGPGNNGGDALVAATVLHRAGRQVEAWLAADPLKLPADAGRAWQEARAAGVPLREFGTQVGTDAAAQPGALPDWPAGTAAILDGLLGIGLNRPAGGRIADWIAHVNASGLPVFALDVPSGLFADTGAGKPAVQAARTLTFLAAKPGLLTLDGRDRAGAVDIAPLGLAYPPPGLPAAWINGPAVFAAALPARRHDSNKGTFGSLAIIGGNAGMVGAPLLGARAAQFLGAGRVHIGFLAPSAPAFDPMHPELMLHALADLDLAAMSTLVIGPGMGAGATSRQHFTQLLHALAGLQAALVLDADALNMLAADAGAAQALRALASPRVLTPHPLEAARLLGSSVEAVQRDRLAAARALAAQWQATVVLKGSGSVIAGTDGAVPALNPSGNAGLASAGTGDVLAGMIGALLAQGMSATQAACAGTWIHGRAADRLTAAGEGPAGLTASELYLPARAILNALLREPVRA
ncbi:bifunctional ADP-dependent NAD(P)H-hydrate dehydratase/NAD(P)H-hydrate epimerase [Cupriavidus malaysiensis]|uniref:Bifunctional NAD(P)H-hydrate repair enzyme n=1 Tax=Cupriavidus malaysiensis TaxID=367825 RepID=A0ABN4TGW6_9BURK|nr:bifunctional ADP-dependent NAD(P)H-hydrate dehydratase/NAD(P)H-hydrate epimerase [Cupriavidus malaysiensis]AOZ06402.1 bifunctional ADP-dependent (S)-NAD(P)H-hydrate dehydratase/NAD(P)H-hydrate epimerase [Cupriavidus malaysiensis]